MHKTKRIKMVLLNLNGADARKLVRQTGSGRLENFQLD